MPPREAYKVLLEVLEAYPESLDKELFIAHLEPLLEHRPRLLEDILVILARFREDLWKVYGQKSHGRIAQAAHNPHQHDGNHLRYGPTSAAGPAIPRCLLRPMVQGVEGGTRNSVSKCSKRDPSNERTI